MRYFNIASDFKKETIDEYAKLNEKYHDAKVIETYGQITIGNLFAGGRVYVDIPKIDMNFLKEYVKYSAKHNIHFNYCINGLCMGNYEFTKEGVASLKRFFSQLHKIGVKRLTIAAPSVMEIVKICEYDFEIKVSIINQINSVNKAVTYKKMGVDRIVVDESMNRDFATLKRIRNEFGPKVEVIANSLCHKDCIYRMFHYSQTAHDSVDKLESSINTYYNHKCMLKRADNVRDMLQLCWIRPEDIHYYEEIGIEYYKLQGRHVVFNGDPIRTMECYFSREYDGNLIDLLELFNSPYSFKHNLDNKKLENYILPFVKDGGFCIKDCNHCGYCERFYQNNLDYKKAIQINSMATKYYSECDEYSILLKKDEVEQEVVATLEKYDIQFDIDFSEEE